MQDKESILHSYSNRVHKVLAHSYSFYFIFFLCGVLLDIIFPIKIFKATYIVSYGFTFLVLGTLLIFWAQRTSLHLEKAHLTKEAFCHGPYCYTRSPTHWGLFLLMLGFGMIANAFFVIVLTIVAFFLTKLIFLKREEALLVKKYGEPYIEYKRAVKF